ncbi:ATP:cob(I)alamin adenosyltransferase [Nanoarchaeota archaeon]
MRKAYTRIGDEGYSRNLYGKKVSKGDVSILVEGKLDVLQAALDPAVLQEKGKYRKMLESVQRRLWQVAAQVSCGGKKCSVGGISEREVKDLERFIDLLGEPPQEFIRFRNPRAIVLNECRVRCRELETALFGLLKSKKISKEVFAYINRLSSLLYMMAYKRK